MTPFSMLLVVLGVLATAWLTRSRWLPAAAMAATDITPCAHTLRSLGIAAALALFVLAGPVACYLLLGAPNTVEAGIAPAAAASAAKATRPPRGQRAELPADASHADSFTQSEALAEQLAQRLIANPDDADGWQALGRAHASAGHHAQAVIAFQSALQRRPDDATLLAEAAFSAAVTDPQAASGDAARLVERALQAEPNNAKALALAGALAVDRRNYQDAVHYWERLAQTEPPDSPVSRQLRSSIRQAQQLASMHAGVMQVAARRDEAIVQIGAPVTRAAPLRFALGDSTAVASNTRLSRTDGGGLGAMRFEFDAALGRR